MQEGQQFEDADSCARKRKLTFPVGRAGELVKVFEVGKGIEMSIGECLLAEKASARCGIVLESRRRGWEALYRRGSEVL